MKYDVEKREIVSEKELNWLDKFTIDFTNILSEFTEYVIISGYVSILLGRSRSTEDIDLFIPEMSFDVFNKFFNEILKKFECMNAYNSKEAFALLKEPIALRFFYSGFPVPNIEVKFIKTGLDKFAFSNKLKVIMGEKELFISPLELQIAFKLFLGSDKDFEDAKHLYYLFDDKLNRKSLELFINKLSVREAFEKIK